MMLSWAFAPVCIKSARQKGTREAKGTEAKGTEAKGTAENGTEVVKSDVPSCRLTTSVPVSPQQRMRTVMASPIAPAVCHPASASMRRRVIEERGASVYSTLCHVHGNAGKLKSGLARHDGSVRDQGSGSRSGVVQADPVLGSIIGLCKRARLNWPLSKQQAKGTSRHT